MTENEKLKHICLLYYNLAIDGTDNTTEAFEFMRNEGFLDEDNEWIYDENRELAKKAMLENERLRKENKMLSIEIASYIEEIDTMKREWMKRDD